LENKILKKFIFKEKIGNLMDKKGEKSSFMERFLGSNFLTILNLLRLKRSSAEKGVVLVTC
jgi:hypothetical protein